MSKPFAYRYDGTEGVLEVAIPRGGVLRGMAPATRSRWLADRAAGSRARSGRTVRRPLLAAIGEHERQKNRNLQDDRHQVHHNSFDPIAFPYTRHVGEAR